MDRGENRRNARTGARGKMGNGGAGLQIKLRELCKKIYNRGVMKIPSKVRPLDGFCLFVEFPDGVGGVVDLSHLKGNGVFAFWNEQNFKKIKIGAFGELIWNDDVEICSDSLYLKLSGKSVEEVFQENQQEQAHA